MYVPIAAATAASVHPVNIGRTGQESPTQVPYLSKMRFSISSLSSRHAKLGTPLRPCNVMVSLME